jgi:hypothetical protein
MEIALIEKRIMWCANSTKIANWSDLCEGHHKKTTILQLQNKGIPFSKEGYGHMTVISEILHHATGSSVSSI